MKHSDIDKQIEELTQKARELERQREALAALDVCNAQGHEVVIHNITGTLTDVSAINLRCRICGARVHLRVHGDGEPWRLFDLENKGHLLQASLKVVSRIR